MAAVSRASGRPARREFETFASRAELPHVPEIRVAGREAGVLGFFGCPCEPPTELLDAPLGSRGSAARSAAGS